MATAIAVAVMTLAAAGHGTYTNWLSHLNLRNRFGSARTRRSATTPGGFAISKAIGGVLQA
jgi:putative effector of murein hydrolase